MTPAMFHVKQRDFGTPNGVWQGSNRGQTRIKTARTALLMVASAVMLAACSSPEEIAQGTATAQATTAAAQPPAPPTPPAVDAAKVEFTDNAADGEAKREFAYGWPAEAAAIPALAARLTADRDKLLAEQKADWSSALKEFGNSDCIGCVNRDLSKTWEVVANLPRFLSLSYGFYAYTGGAHGNSASGGLVWDREADAAVEPRAFFTSAKAMQDVLGPRWCKALSGARRAKMGGEGPVDESTFPCPPIADLTVLLGSKGKTGFDRIGLIADPYVAGSYAEGDYEVTIPVTADILAIVKPEYKAAFNLGK